MILSWPLPVLVIVILSHLDVVLAQNITCIFVHPLLTSTLFLHVHAEAQCVQVTSINSPEPCPCNEVAFEFSLEGETSLENNVVKIALVLDGSNGVGQDNFETEKEFAKSVTASFAESNLFANGGTASYVQFGGSVDTGHTYTSDSLDDFNDFVDADTYISESRGICTGINSAAGLLNDAGDASAAFMFVVVYGDEEISGDVAGCAANARADGITLMAIGAGDEVSNSTLVDIADSAEYIFRADYDELESLVDDLVEASTGSCPATTVELAVTYGATVVSTTFPDASIEGDIVTFNVDSLDGNLMEFPVVLNSCGASGSSFHPVENIEYNDVEGNSPNFTALLDTTIETCPDAQCVQVTSINSPEPCPCNEVAFEFSLEGETSLENNVVNIALVLDGSTGAGSDNFETEKRFAKSVTAIFTRSNLFANGGTASYVQFGESVDPGHTYTSDSLDDFNDFVNADIYLGTARGICTGIDAARDLLNDAPDASAAFMYVVIYGDDEISGDVAGCAANARADGITLMAIGAGAKVSFNTLVDITGSTDYVFWAITGEIGYLIDGVVQASTGSCPATTVELAVTYGATVVSTTFPDASIEGDIVTFNVDNLEGNLTPFSVLLNSCGTSGSSFHPVESIEYYDDEGNSPDFTALLNTTIDTCPGGNVTHLLHVHAHGPDVTATSSTKLSSTVSTKASIE